MPRIIILWMQLIQRITKYFMNPFPNLFEQWKMRLHSLKLFEKNVCQGKISNNQDLFIWRDFKVIEKKSQRYIY